MIFSDKPGPNYAPFVIAKHPGASGVVKTQLQKAMDRLFGAGRIKVIETGSPSRRQRKIVITGSVSDESAISEDETDLGDAVEHPSDGDVETTE